MTPAPSYESSSILSALQQLSATWHWGSPPKLLTISHRPPKPTVPSILAGSVGGQTALDLLEHWIDQCRHHRGIVDVQRDLGVDAVGVSFEQGGRHVAYAMDRAGLEYLALGERSVPERHLTSGTNLLEPARLPDLLAERLAELVWRLAGWPTPVPGSRIRDMWPKAGLVDLDEDELHERYASPSPTECSVRLLTVASIDGLAAVDESCAALTSPGDQRIYRLVKRSADLLLLGAGTVRAERYGPTVLSAPEIARRRADGLRPYPAIAVVTRSLDLDLTGPLFQQHTGRHVPPRPILIVPVAAMGTIRSAIAEHAEIIVAGDLDVDLGQALQALRDRGYRHIVCEGGPSLAGQMAQAGLLDEICMTVAPKMLAVAGPRVTAGSGTRPAPDEWQLSRSLLDEQGNVFLRYTRLRGA